MRMVAANGAGLGNNDVHIAVIWQFVARQGLEYSAAHVAVTGENIDAHGLVYD
jgi:hypothetical protein